MVKLFRWDSLGFRLPVLIAIFVTMAAVSVGGVIYYVAERAITDAARRDMEFVRNERARAIESWVEAERMALGAFAARPGPPQAVKELSTIFAAMDGEARARVRAAYTTENPYPFGARMGLVDPNDGSDYSAAHARHHDALQKFTQIRKMHDLILVSAKGDVIYSVSKEDDFGTNLLDGPFRDSVASRVFLAAIANSVPGTQVFSDMAFYEPSRGPALFMAQQVRSDAGETAGVIIFQLPLEKLRDIANHIDDLGETGEVYLVGSDQTRRSATRFSVGELVTERITAPAAAQAALGITGSEVTLDYRGIPVVAAFAPINLMGVRWGIVAKIDLAEATAALRPVLTTIVLVTVMVASIAAFVGFGVSRRVARPLERALTIMDRLSAGDLQVDVPPSTGMREVRQVSDSLRVFRENLVQRERLASEVRKLSAQFVSFMESTPDLVSIHDRQLRYLAASQSLAEQIGLSSWRQVVGKTSSDLYAPDVSRATDAEVLELLSGRINAVENEQTNLLDGVEITRAIKRVRIMDPSGEVIGVLSVSRDVTQLKQSERSMAAAKEAAEAATKAKSDFLASMSHEIRTPMNGITGMAELLAQTSLSDDQAHMVRTIRDSGASLIKVINDILDFSKIEAGKLDLEDVGMSLSDAVETVATTLTSTAAQKGLRIHVYCQPTLPTAVQGDPTRVRQILFNLGGNAIKFANGKDVAIRVMELSRTTAQVRVRFEVVDHGIGISRDNQAKLFRAFSQAESSTTRKYGGTGLGLAICKRLTELMGGTIGVDSVEGLGSTFWVEIDFLIAEKSRSKEKQRDLSNLSVWVVGSPEPRASAIKDYIEHHGAICLMAASLDDMLSGASALAMVDAIMIDECLDRDAQVATLARLKADPKLSQVPKILMEDFQKRGPRITPPDLVTVDVNPVIRHRLVTSVAVAAGRASPQVKPEDGASGLRAVTPSVAEAARLGRLILLAEDNPTNQDVIRRQLALLGFACEIVDNGAQALKAYATGRFALLLTDCHMPEMDGYELTARIRGMEQGTEKRVPIIAVTANALQGEAERCLAAGMDDYVSKPVAMPALRAALQKWMPEQPNKNAEPVALSSEQSRVAPHLGASGNDPIDPRVIKGMFGDDEETFKDILKSFIDPSQSIIDEIRTGCERLNAGAVRDAAHKLKSAARSVGALALGDTSAALEAAGKAGDWGQIPSLTATSELQFRAIVAYINAV